MSSLLRLLCVAVLTSLLPCSGSAYGAKPKLCPLTLQEFSQRYQDLHGDAWDTRVFKQKYRSQRVRWVGYVVGFDEDGKHYWVAPQKPTVTEHMIREAVTVYVKKFELLPKHAPVIVVGQLSDMKRNPPYVDADALEQISEAQAQVISKLPLTEGEKDNE